MLDMYVAKEYLEIVDHVCIAVIGESSEFVKYPFAKDTLPNNFLGWRSSRILRVSVRPSTEDRKGGHLSFIEWGAAQGIPNSTSTCSM